MSVTMTYKSQKVKNPKCKRPNASYHDPQIPKSQKNQNLNVPMSVTMTKKSKNVEHPKFKHPNAIINPQNMKNSKSKHPKLILNDVICIKTDIRLK